MKPTLIELLYHTLCILLHLVLVQTSKNILPSSFKHRPTLLVRAVFNQGLGDGHGPSCECFLDLVEGDSIISDILDLWLIDFDCVSTTLTRLKFY